MKLPKTVQRACTKCACKTEHKVGLVKAKGRSATHPLSWGSTKRVKGRGLRRGAGNQGKYSKPAIAKFKRTGAKVSKKSAVKYTCSKCKRAVQKVLARSKKVEFE